MVFRKYKTDPGLSSNNLRIDLKKCFRPAFQH